MDLEKKYQKEWADVGPFLPRLASTTVRESLS